MQLTATPIVLASQSPRRIHLLREAGFQVEVIPSLADEKDAQHHDIHEIVVENARIKGAEVVARLQAEGRHFARPTVLVAADTLVVLGEKVYGKPRDMAEAERFQMELSGVEHQVFTGVYLVELMSGRELSFYVTTGVTLVQRTLEQIRHYFTIVNPLDKAAAYGYQDAREIVAQMRGSETNVIGLPMEALHEHLARLLAAEENHPA